MIELLSDMPAHTVGVKLSGTLHDEDYKMFVPMVDAAIAEVGKTRILVWFHDFRGWDAHALWDDIAFATTHCTTIQRIAMVGEKTWEKWMGTFCKPFTMATVKVFDIADIDAARAWIAEGGL